MNYDVIIVGGGASGLVAAITSARRGQTVLVIEHKEKVAKKILATGNGKCNYTNTYYDDQVYRSDCPSFVYPALEQFGVSDTIAFFQELGIYPKDRNGYLYPNSGQASSLLEVLRMEVDRLGITVLCEEHVDDIKKKKTFFDVNTNKQSYRGKSVILCTGGKASENLGSDGSGYTLAKSLGHTIVPVVPALTALRSDKKYFKMVSGVRTDVCMTLRVDRKKVTSESGELQLTDYGVSGIPTFQISRYATRALYEKKMVDVVIDFLPNISFNEAVELLQTRIRFNKKKTIEECLIGLLNNKLNSLVIKESGLSMEKEVGSLTKQEITKLVNSIKNFTVPITNSNAFSQSQVCAGGVDTRQINPNTMESTIVEGLYFAGEVIDVDGTCGGYNLQWAWSSGYVAGTHCNKTLRKDKHD